MEVLQSIHRRCFFHICIQVKDCVLGETYNQPDMSRYKLCDHHQYVHTFEHCQNFVSNGDILWKWETNVTLLPWILFTSKMDLCVASFGNPISDITDLSYVLRLRPCVSNQESIDLPGHFSSLQVTCSLAFDISQGIPSGSGTGLLHIRDRDLVPPLQEAEHSENWLHELHPPFTVKWIRVNVCSLLCKVYEFLCKF